MESKLAELVARLEVVTNRLENAKVLGGAGGEAQGETYNLEVITKAIEAFKQSATETNIPQIVEMVTHHSLKPPLILVN